jgi:hypothetical protein
MPGVVQPNYGDDDTVTSRRVRSHPGRIPRTAVPIALPLLVGRDGESRGRIPDDTAGPGGERQKRPCKVVTCRCV